MNDPDGRRWSAPRRVGLLVAVVAVLCGLLSLALLSEKSDPDRMHPNSRPAEGGNAQPESPESEPTQAIGPAKGLVRGRCLSAVDDSAINGATIRTGTSEVASDDSGEFALAVDPKAEGQDWLHVEALGYEKAAVPLREIGNLGVIRLIPAPSLRGRVTLPDGQSAPEALVVLTRSGAVLDRPEVMADGTFHISLTSRMRALVDSRRPALYIAAFSRGYGPARMRVEFPGPELEIQLVEGAIASGYVRDSIDARPLEGTRLWLRQTVRGPSLAGAWVLAKTDEDGHFSISETIPGGLWQVVFDHPGYALSWAHVAPGASEINVDLHRAGPMAGVVVAAGDGASVEGAYVRVLLPDMRRTEHGVYPILPDHHTDSAGRFLLERVPAGTSIRLTAAKGVARTESRFHGLPPQEIQLSLDLPDHIRTARVRVVDEGDLPLGGMTVRFTAVSPQSAGTIELSCELTDSQGWTAIQVPTHYSLRGALSATGRERFGCSKDLHFLPEWPDEGVTLTATSTRLVRGMLQFPEGESKTKTKVTVWRDIGGSVAPRVSDVWVDSTGRFVAAADGPGPGVLSVEGEDISPLLVRFETGAGNRVTDVGEIALSKGRRLSGSVVSRSGRPLSSVLIRARLEPPWSKYFPASRWTARTGVDGTFELRNPPMEPIVIEARPSASAGHVTTVTAIPGEGPVTIVIPVE